MAQYLGDWSDEQRDYYLGKTQKPTPENDPPQEKEPPQEEGPTEPPDDVDWSKEMFEGKIINGVDFTPKTPKPRPKNKKKPNLNL